MAAVLATAAPLVLPLDLECTGAEGYISVGSADAAAQPSAMWVRVSGAPAGAPTLAGARLEVGAELAELLEGHEDLVAARLAESPSLGVFFVELHNVASRLGAAPPAARPAAFYRALLAELQALGWASVARLADDLSTVTLQIRDAAGRRHALDLSLPPGFPAAAPAAAADLPVAFAPRWGPDSSLAGVLSQFEAAVQQHQALWDSLDDIDARAWVVEPVHPKRSVAFRRLALGNHVTLAVTLDPLHPGAHPECRFMGAECAVEPLLNKLHANRACWRPDALLRENLEAALGVALPGRQAAGGGAPAEDVSADCAICYAYRLPAAGGSEGAEGEVPDVNCDTPACGKPFHRRCLAEWLAADTATRQSFGTLFGACPYCSAPITAKVA